MGKRNPRKVGDMTERQYAFQLAASLKRDPVYIYNVLLGFQTAGAKLALEIERASLGLYPKEKLRPDLWASP